MQANPGCGRACGRRIRGSAGSFHGGVRRDAPRRLSLCRRQREAPIQSCMDRELSNYRPTNLAAPAVETARTTPQFSFGTTASADQQRRRPRSPIDTQIVRPRGILPRAGDARNISRSSDDQR